MEYELQLPLTMLLSSHFPSSLDTTQKPRADRPTALTFNRTAEGSDTSVRDEVAFQMLWPHEALVALVTLELAQVQMLGTVTFQLAGRCECPVATL